LTLHLQAIGLCNGDVSAVNWWVVGLALFGWILTIPFAAMVGALFYAMGAYSPSNSFVDLYMNASNQTTTTHFAEL
jgi:hypothetical protein